MIRDRQEAITELMAQLMRSRTVARRAKLMGRLRKHGVDFVEEKPDGDRTAS